MDIDSLVKLLAERDHYYVYTFAYPDGRVFYVGKGSGDRIKSHLWEAGGKRTSVSRVASVIRSLWQRGEKVIIRKPYKNLTEMEALRRERILINLYGYEQLVNQSWYSCRKHRLRNDHDQATDPRSLYQHSLVV